MLGNLFDTEDDDLLSALAASVDGTSEKSRAPPHPRPQSKLAGIANQGATCYLNSLLQTLLLTPEFRGSLFQLPESELGCLDDREKPGAKVRVIPLQLQRLFTRLLLLDQQSVSTEELTESFGWTNNEQFQQHDVQELNRILFSAIEDSLAGTSGHNLIQELYHGNIVNQIICEECGKISEREEDFLDLTLSVSGVDSLEKCLKYGYCDIELMDGKNQYRCERCQKLVNAKKGAKIRGLPQILTISLLRFSYDFTKMERFKETGKFTFPMELDMTPYVEKVSSSDEYQYELFSVVIHRGGAYGGHYHAYIRDIDSLGHWVSPGKGDVEIASDPKTGQVELVKTNSPEELIEIILQKDPNHAMPADKLGNEISKQTGVTWNKRFKRNHGSLTKFLSRCEGRLVYNPHTRYVSLVDTFTSLSSASTTTSTSPAPPENSESESTTDVTSCESTVTDSDDRDRRKMQKLLTPDPPPDGHCWFNFDDSRVSPITQSEIEHHFQGKESAYMLFYRRKQSVKPAEAFNNPAYCVPDHLLADVLAENDALDKQREEYDTLVNTVHIELHFEPDYHYKEGALKLIHVEGRFTELSIDRRKTVADLLVMVREVGGNLVPDKLVIHRMQDLPSGLHLYDCISDDADTLLMSLNIDSKTKLFVWDGEQVDGGSIPTGVECEPIYLTIVYGNPSQFSCGFPKNISLGDLRSSICDLTGISEADLSLKKVAGSESSPEFKSLNHEDVTLPLAVLNFRDGDNIIAADKNSEDMTVMEEAARQSNHGNQLSILVENRCVETQSCLSKQIEATKDMTVGELKAMALSAFGESDVLEGGRLRVDHQTLGLRPPLHELQTLGDAGLNSATCVVLEPGKAPESNQITLTFTPYDLPDGEVTVEKTCSVKQCLDTMIQHAGFKGDDWHLRRTNWCGEASEVLDDLDITLDKTLVNDGDHLLLLAGRLPPKGYLRLTISLYPTPDNPRRDGSDQKGMISWITSGIQGLLSRSSMEQVTVSDLEPLPVGEVEISKDATLEDLKLQVMTLPALQDLPVPTLDFMRLRIVENHRPGPVLKGLTHTLRWLKATSASHIAMQILPQEENLGPNEIVVNIQQRLPGTLLYTPAQEFIWDVSRSASPQDFRQCVADFLVQPVEQVVIAKHFPRQFKWVVVEETKVASHNTKSQPTNQKGRKKKGGGGKSSMKQAPYHLQDGDIIGVKTVQGDPDNRDDFSTEEDVKGREEAHRAAEEKRKMREERKKAYGDGPVSGRRPEVALTIKVDSFT